MYVYIYQKEGGGTQFTRMSLLTNNKLREKDGGM